MILPGLWESASSYLVFILRPPGHRIRLLGVPPWRFALGWRSRSMSDSLLMLDYMIRKSRQIRRDYFGIRATESTGGRLDRRCAACSGKAMALGENHRRLT